MNYYEDLGLSPNATPEQIREAYKALVRLLHPDQQTDPLLKQAAEIQMRRINRAYAVLSEPQLRRQHYEEQTKPPEPPPQAVIRPPKPVMRPEPRRNYLLWVAVALGSLGILFWLATQSPAHSSVPAMQAAAASTVPPVEQRPALAVAALPQRATAQPTQQATVQPPAEAPISLPKGFTGKWAYARDKGTQPGAGLYSPQYIEASIMDQDGMLRGRYQARYDVSDRPISPNVNFEFEGQVEGGNAKLPWHGDGGSQGELEIRLLSDDALELSWRATDFGQTLGLASGTAVLVRRPY